MISSAVAVITTPTASFSRPRKLVFLTYLANLILGISKFGILREPPIQGLTKNKEKIVLFNKFHRRINPDELLFSYVGSGNKIAFSKFWNLPSFGYLTYKFLLRKIKTWVLCRKFYRRTNPETFFDNPGSRRSSAYSELQILKTLGCLPHNSWLTNLMATCFCNPGLRKSSAHSKFRNSKFDILAKKVKSWIWFGHFSREPNKLHFLL
jgi:hypothetical protein